jgi:hypothetical protein
MAESFAPGSATDPKQLFRNMLTISKIVRDNVREGGKQSQSASTQTRSRP